MTVYDPISGNEVDIVVGEESTFGTAASSIDEVLGLKQKWNYDLNKNMERYHDLGLRTPSKIQELKWEGSFDLEAVLANELFWPYVLSDGAGTGGDPYVFDATGDPKSFTTKVHDRGEGQFRNFLGCCVNDWTLSGNVGEDLMMKFSGLIASISDKSASGTRAGLSIDGLDNPFNFKHATMNIAGAGAGTQDYWGLMQKFELKLTQQLEYYWGFGSRLANTKKWHDAIGGIVMGVKKSSNATKQSLDAMEDGDTDGSNISVVIAITDGSRTITITLAGNYLNQVSTGYEAFSDIDETLTFIFQTISVVLAGF